MQPVQPKINTSVRLAQAIVELATLDRDIQQASLALEDMRDDYAKKKHLLFELGYSTVKLSPQVTPPVYTDKQHGTMKKIVRDRGFGFIAGDDGFDYFFHLADLQHNFPFQDLFETMHCTFSIKNPALPLKAGAAQNVEILDDQPQPHYNR
jgi:cold shock CspA family protein